MKVTIFKNHEAASREFATRIVDCINQNPKTILGLATGGTMEKTYDLLVEDYKDGKVSFAKVTTYNLDEYLGLLPDHPQSYHYYMNTRFFNHIDVKKENINIPKGLGDVEKNAKDFEEKINQNGLDLQILSLGVNGHIAYNEPGSSFDSITRKIKLTKSTLQNNSRFFKSVNDVPKAAISMGIATIMKAKKILVLGTGKNKAQAIKSMIEGSYSKKIPASALQKHPNVEVVLDKDGASLLSK